MSGELGSMDDAEMPAHPATNAFPMLGEDRLMDLAQDIETHGLREPITVLDGMVLDGRNRLRACALAGVAPRFVEYDGNQPVAFVRSMNLRRDLSKSQRSMAAAKLRPLLAEEARQRQLAGAANLKKGSAAPVPALLQEPGKTNEHAGESAAQAGASVGVSGRYVYMATRVLEESPEMTAEVEAGSMTVSAAFAALGAPGDDKRRTERKPRAERIAEIERLAGQGYRADQIASEIGVGVTHVRDIAVAEGIALPDHALGRTRRIDARRVIEETVHALAGYAIGLQTIQSSPLDDISADESAEWAASIATAVKAINKLRTQLLERAK